MDSASTPSGSPQTHRRFNRGLLYAGIGLGAIFLLGCVGVIIATSWWLGRPSEASIVIRGRYDSRPPSPEDIRREWGVIIHDVLFVGSQEAEGIRLEPLPDGNFRLTIRSDSKGTRGKCKMAAEDYARLKAEGIPPRYRAPDDELWALSGGNEVFPVPASAEAWRKLEQIRVPKVEFVNAAPVDVLYFVRDMLAEGTMNPEMGFKVEWEEGEFDLPPVTLTLERASLRDILRAVDEALGVRTELNADGSGWVVRRGVRSEDAVAPGSPAK